MEVADRLEDHFPLEVGPAQLPWLSEVGYKFRLAIATTEGASSWHSRAQPFQADGDSECSFWKFTASLSRHKIKENR